MLKNILFRAALSFALLVNSPVCAHSANTDDSIFAAPPQAAPVVAPVSLDTLAESATMRDHAAEVMAAAEVKLDKMEKDGMVTAAEKIQIKGWFKGLPFQRIVDVKISFFSGLPDFVGLCLEANPSQFISIDACAGSILFISSLSAHVASRFLHYVNVNGKPNADGSVSYSGNEFSVGPKAGVRAMNFFGIDSSSNGWGVDALISAEWVHWFSRYFGMGLSLEGGATIVVQEGGINGARVIPNGKLSVGLSF
ncbi:MAG: hypothetical protein HY074_06875 [Deltaproteobacteria bacterium]|nr:hypothetical protein [Deltaproteobacteria bacterium]